jgi:hypothetical protein
MAKRYKFAMTLSRYSEFGFNDFPYIGPLHKADIINYYYYYYYNDNSNNTWRLFLALKVGSVITTDTAVSCCHSVLPVTKVTIEFEVFTAVTMNLLERDAVDVMCWEGTKPLEIEG